MFITHTHTHTQEGQQLLGDKSLEKTRAQTDASKQVEESPKKPRLPRDSTMAVTAQVCGFCACCIICYLLYMNMHIHKHVCSDTHTRAHTHTRRKDNNCSVIKVWRRPELKQRLLNRLKSHQRNQDSLAILPWLLQHRCVDFVDSWFNII